MSKHPRAVSVEGSLGSYMPSRNLFPLSVKRACRGCPGHILPPDTTPAHRATELQRRLPTDWVKVTARTLYQIFSAIDATMYHGEMHAWLCSQRITLVLQISDLGPKQAAQTFRDGHSVTIRINGGVFRDPCRWLETQLDTPPWVCLVALMAREMQEMKVASRLKPLPLVSRTDLMAHLKTNPNKLYMVDLTHRRVCALMQLVKVNKTDAVMRSRPSGQVRNQKPTETVTVPFDKIHDLDGDA